MSDEPWYSPWHKTPPRLPKPGERIWTLQKNGRQVACELRFHGESYGWESQFLYDSVLVYGQRFVLRAGALAEAEAQHTRLIDEGWTAAQTPEPTEP